MYLVVEQDGSPSLSQLYHEVVVSYPSKQDGQGEEGTTKNRENKDWNEGQLRMQDRRVGKDIWSSSQIPYG